MELFFLPISKSTVEAAREELNKLKKGGEKEGEEGEEEEDPFVKILKIIKYPNPRKNPYIASYEKMDGLISALEGAVENLGDVINNSSIVLELTYCKRTVLLTGDAEFDEWETILKHYNDKKENYELTEMYESKNEKQDKKTEKKDVVRIDIFKVPHHGGKCGNYLEEPYDEIGDKIFDEFLNFKFAAISVGPHKKYNHPHPITRDKLMNRTEARNGDKNYHRFYRTDDLNQGALNKKEYNKLSSLNGKGGNYRILSYIFGIIPQINGEKINTEEKAIVYPYRVMIKEEQYKQIT